MFVLARRRLVPESNNQSSHVFETQKPRTPLAFHTQSVHDKARDRDKDVQRTMDLLRALENARLPVGRGGFLQLQEAVRPRSYTHELLKGAGLKYRRGKPVFEDSINARRSASALSYVDGPDHHSGHHRYREQGTGSVAVVDRRSRSATPGLNQPHSMVVSMHSQLGSQLETNASATVRGPRGILRSTTRPAALAPLNAPFKVAGQQHGINQSLSISLPVLCKLKTSETAALAAATAEPDTETIKQNQIDQIDLDIDDRLKEDFQIVANKRLKASRAALAKNIALSVDDKSILLNTMATRGTIAHHIVTHNGEARDTMRRVLHILGDMFGIDIREYGIPIRVTDSVAEIRDSNMMQKTRLNAHSLDCAPRAACIKTEILLPKGMGRHLHTAAYYKEDAPKGDLGGMTTPYTSGGSGKIKLPPMGHQRVNVEASVARAHAKVHRDVEEFVVVRGMSRYQLSGEIAKVVGSAFLFLEYYEGLDAHTEGAFCELCSYVWAKEEKAQLLTATAGMHMRLVELEGELEYVQQELALLQVQVANAHKERDEANEAELHAKKTLSAARDSVKYGWPGAERKMQAAKQAEIDAARELEEASQAEDKVIGKEYPDALAKRSHVQVEMAKVSEQLAEMEAAMSAYSMYMLTQENNPHPIYGDTFRKALLGLESVEGRMRVFLGHLKDTSHFIQPRPKTREEMEEEAAEQSRAQQAERDLQAQAQREQLGTLFGRITDRLKSAPPGAPGMPAALSYQETFIRVPTELAQTFDQQVLAELDDKMRNLGTGELTSKELSQYCAMTIRGEHDAGYCLVVGEKALADAKQMRFTGDLDNARTALVRADSALKNAGPAGEKHTGELEHLEKIISREWNQLQKAIGCHQLCEKSLHEGSLTNFRRYWNEAKSLYESCGAVAQKERYLPALVKWDEMVKHQEKDLKDMTDATDATAKALKVPDMSVAAHQVYLANSYAEKCGKTGVELTAKAKDLLQKVLATLVEQRQQQEALCKMGIETGRFVNADDAIVQVWKCCRLSAIALGEVQHDGDDKLLLLAEKNQARLQGSAVVSLFDELCGTKEQDLAMAIVGSLDLTMWPATETKVLDMKAKATEALTHLTKGRKYLEAAGTAQAHTKLLAVQAVELDLALRVHSNDIVKKLLTNPNKESPNGAPPDALPFICTAAAANNVQALNLLIDVNGDVNLVDAKLDTPVHHSVRSMAWDALKMLGKNRKTNPNKVNTDMLTPLHMAVMGKVTLAPTGMKNVIKRTLSNPKGTMNVVGVMTSAKNQKSMHAYLEAVTILLTEYWKIVPNTVAGKFATTALHLAGEISNASALEMLLKNSKVDPNIMDARGRSPLIAAIWSKQDISQFLSCSKVNVNLAIPKTGWTPMHVCIVKNSIDCMKVLLGCDSVSVGEEDMSGFTPTHLALLSDSDILVDMLMASTVVQQVGGPKLVQLLETARSFHGKGDPANRGLWTQATRELLELLPALLLKLRMWDTLHATLCNVAFAAIIIENLGVDTAIALYASTTEEVVRYQGADQGMCNDFTQYQHLLEKHSFDIRTGKISFTHVAIENSLWGVRNAKHSVAHIVEQVDEIRAAVASKEKKWTDAFFDCLAMKQDMHIIQKYHIHKILPSQRSFQRASTFVKQIYDGAETTMEDLDNYFVKATQEATPENAQAIDKEITLEQITSLLSIPKNQTGVGALKVVMKNSIDVSTIKSRLCEVLSIVVPNNESHVMVRVTRVFEHLGKIVAIVILSKNPFKACLTFAEGRLQKTLNALVDCFRGKSNDLRMQPLIQQLKILTITAIEPSVFIVLDLVPPWTVTRLYKDKQEYAGQVLNDFRNSINLQANLLRVAKVSENWNHAVVELLHDDVNPSKSLARNRVMAERIVSMVNSPSTVLHKGVVTQFIASCTTIEGHEVPRSEGEWQDFTVHVVASSMALHNELEYLEELILPAARQFATLGNSYLSWSISHDDMLPPNTKKLKQNLKDMEIHEAQTDILIGLVDDRFGTVLTSDSIEDKTSDLAMKMQHSFLDRPDSQEVFVFMRELENLEGIVYPHQYRAAVSDSENAESSQLLKQLKGKLDKHDGRRVHHYAPSVRGGFRLDISEIFKRARDDVSKWEASKERLDKLQECTGDANDLSSAYAIQGSKNRMQEAVVSCGRWIKVLYAEIARGGVPAELLNGAKGIADLPIFADQPDVKAALEIPDLSDVRFGMGLDLDVKLDMFHVGLVIVDCIKAKSAPLLPKPPLHSHLLLREILEVMRISCNDHLCIEEGSKQDQVLQKLLSATCPPPLIERARPFGRAKSADRGDGASRTESTPEVVRKPIVMLTGGEGSGKTVMLAVLSKRLFAARYSNLPAVPHIQIYYKMRNRHLFSKAIRYLHMELAVQLQGRDALKIQEQHMGDWQVELAVLKKKIEGLSPGIRVVFLLDGFAVEHRQVLAELLLSLHDKHEVQCVMSAEAESIFLPDTVADDKMSIIALGGLSTTEQKMILCNFGERFQTRNLTEAEYTQVVGAAVAQSPLYLIVYAMVCVIKPPWVNTNLKLPEDVAKLFELFVIPFVSDWLRVPAEVIEAVLEVAQMNPLGIRLDSMQIEVRGQLPPALRAEASMSKMSMMITLLAPIWGSSRTIDGLIALAHPSLVKSIANSVYLSNALGLSDSRLQKRKVINLVQQGFDTENTDPKLQAKIDSLAKHAVVMFNLHCTKPMFLALSEDDDWTLPPGSFVSVEDVLAASQLSEEGPDESGSFKVSASCQPDLALDPCEAIMVACAAWCVKAERILNEFDVDEDVDDSLQIEPLFDACYRQSLKVEMLAQSLQDEDTVVASVGLQIAAEIWNGKEIVDTEFESLGADISKCLEKFQEISVRIINQLEMLKVRCEKLSLKLIQQCNIGWAQRKYLPGTMKDSMSRMVYDSVSDFRGQMELLQRRATLQVNAGGGVSVWQKLTLGVIREACENLSASLHEEAARVTQMVSRKMESIFSGSLQELRACLEIKDIHRGLDVYEDARTCGCYPVEAVDTVDPTKTEQGLTQLWTLKRQLDKACDVLITYGATSVAFGPAFTIEDAVVGIPTLFIIQSKNKKGVKLGTGAETEGWEIQILDVQGAVDFELTDNKNGTYEVEFTPRFETGCEVAIAFRAAKATSAVPMLGSPFRLNFRRDSFWSLKTVFGLPKNVPGRTFFVATPDVVMLLDMVQKEVYRLSPDEHPDAVTRVWRCQKGRFSGDNVNPKSRGVFALSSTKFVCYTDSLSPLYDGFSDCMTLLDMKDKSTVFAKTLVTSEQDPPSELVQVFCRHKDWAWSNSSCHITNKVAGIPELLLSDQVEASPDAASAADGAAEGAANDEVLLPILSLCIAGKPPMERKESTNFSAQGLDLVKYAKALVNGSSHRYEDLSVPIIVASVKVEIGKVSPVAMMMTHFDQYFRAWRKRSAAVYCDGKLVVFGGSGEHSKVLTCYQPEDAEKERAGLEFQTHEVTGHIPCSRCNFFLAYSGKKIVLHGGIDQCENILNDVYTYDLEMHRWDHLMSGSIPNTCMAMYASGDCNVLALYRGTIHLQLRVLDLNSIVRRDALHQCGHFTNQTITKIRQTIRTNQKELLLQDSWLLRLAVYRSLHHMDFKAMLQNIGEMICFLEMHKDGYGLDLTDLENSADNTTMIYNEMVKSAADLRSKLKKVPQSQAPHGHIETVYRLRIKDLIRHDVTLNAEFARISTGEPASIQAIEAARQQLHQLRRECITFEEQTLFFGVTILLQEEKSIIDKQLETLGYFRRAWTLYRSLFDWAQVPLGHPDSQKLEVVESIDWALQEMSADCDKFATSELHLMLNKYIADVYESCKFVRLTSEKSDNPEDWWHSVRVLCGLSQRILNPATVGTILREEIFQCQNVREFMTNAAKTVSDESLLGRRAASSSGVLLSVVKLCSYLSSGIQGLSQNSMYSVTCFCTISSVLKKSLPVRSAVRFHSKPSLLSVDAMVRNIMSKARMGKLKEFKALLQSQPELLSKAVDSKGNNLMLIAASNGQKKIVKELMRNPDKIDLHARNNVGKNALNLAVDFKYQELAEYLKEKLPELSKVAPPAETKAAKGRCKLHGIRLDFTLHGVYPGGLTKPAGSAYIRSGTHANFIAYVPIKIKTSRSGQAEGSPVDCSAWFIVGHETGPWNFAYGGCFTEVSFQIPADAHSSPSPSTLATPLEQIPLHINLVGDKANAKVVQTMASRGLADASLRYSRSEFMAEFAAYSQRVAHIAQITCRHEDETSSAQIADLANKMIARDSMNRPIVVDGFIRGIGQYSILTQYHRDSLGRIVVIDGLDRNAEYCPPEHDQRDWRKHLHLNDPHSEGVASSRSSVADSVEGGTLSSVAEDVDSAMSSAAAASSSAAAASPSAAAAPTLVPQLTVDMASHVGVGGAGKVGADDAGQQVQSFPYFPIPLSPGTVKTIQDLADSSTSLLHNLPEHASASLMDAVLRGQAPLAYALRSRVCTLLPSHVHVPAVVAASPLAAVDTTGRASPSKCGALSTQNTTTQGISTAPAPAPAEAFVEDTKSVIAHDAINRPHVVDGLVRFAPAAENAVGEAAAAERARATVDKAEISSTEISSTEISSTGSTALAPSPGSNAESFCQVIVRDIMNRPQIVDGLVRGAPAAEK